MKILVSACLLGENCKYSGGNNLNVKLVEYLKDHEIIAVCPEVMGGLPIPRAPGEIVDGVVRNADGTSVDFEYRRGAELALEKALEEGVDFAVLQSRSPSCGVGVIYDGSFSHVKIKGDGIFVQRLKENGIKAYDVIDFTEKIEKDEK